MKRITGILALLLSVFLLAGCGGQEQAGEEDPPVTPSPDAGGTEDEITCVEPPVSALFRIVDGAEDGRLLLAALDEADSGGVFSLNLCETAVWMDGELADAAVLEDGMAIRVTWDDSILETYPAQLSGVRSIEAWSLGTAQDPGGGFYDLCGFYLKVLDDLWQRDPGMNEGVAVAGLDLSNAPGGLTESEKQAVAWRFGELHGVDVITGNFEEYYTAVDLGAEEGPALYQWTDGCLFTIEPYAADTGENYSLPVLRFDASKWRGPWAVYGFSDCSAVWPELGTWSEYSVGAEFIS